MKWNILISMVSVLLGGIVGVVAGYCQATLYIQSLNGKAWAGDGFAFIVDMMADGFWGMVAGGIFAFCFNRWRVRRRQLALELEQELARLRQEALAQSGVWPPPPRNPAV